jgi:hypothetical protein
LGLKILEFRLGHADRELGRLFQSCFRGMKWSYRSMNSFGCDVKEKKAWLAP